MQLILLLSLLVIAACAFFAGCKRDKEPDPVPLYYIETFKFAADKNPGLVFDVSGSVSGDTIRVLLAPGTDLKNLVPTITYKGASMSPVNGVAMDFSLPVHYTITAQNGNRRSYVVIVRHLSTEKAITGFQLRSQENPGLTATISGVISGDTIVVPYSGTLSLNNLIPYITYSGTQLAPNSGVAMDFRQPVEYAVSAEDGTIRRYKVFVTRNKVLYIGSDDGNLYALDAGSGSLRWKFNTGGSVRSSPALADGVVYVGSGDGYMYAIDSATGVLKWKYRFYNAVNSNPVVSGGVVYFNCADKLYALNAATGALKWQLNTGDQANTVASPTVVNGKVYVSTLIGSFSVGAVDALTGQLLWSYQGGICRSNPAVVNGVVYIGGEWYKLIALDAGTGAVKWQYADQNYGGSTSPTVAAGKVFIGGYDGSIYAFDSAAGTLQWKFASNGIKYMGYQSAIGITVGLWSSSVYADGILFAGNNDGENYAINANTGSAAWIYGNTLSANPAATQATVANGIAFFGTVGGDVVALDAATGNLKWKFKTMGGVYSGACVVSVDGVIARPGGTGDTQ